jgi:hypothetical protein
VATLSGHENGVSVLGLPNGVIATASTGKQSGQDTIVGCTVRLFAQDDPAGNQPGSAPSPIY